MDWLKCMFDNDPALDAVAGSSNALFKATDSDSDVAPSSIGFEFSGECTRFLFIEVASVLGSRFLVM